ncbi:unnamed protein product, partial [Ectocarpus sp. 13 AM-2016]
HVEGHECGGREYGVLLSCVLSERPWTLSVRLHLFLEAFQPMRITERDKQQADKDDGSARLLRPDYDRSKRKKDGKTVALKRVSMSNMGKKFRT